MSSEIRMQRKKKPDIFKLFLGLFLLFSGGLAIFIWWNDVLSLLKGCTGISLFLLGIVILAIAKD